MIPSGLQAPSSGQQGGTLGTVPMCVSEGEVQRAQGVCARPPPRHFHSTPPYAGGTDTLCMDPIRFQPTGARVEDPMLSN